jgi:hypothetical protein
MREICMSGSEGGESQPNAASLPLSDQTENEAPMTVLQTKRTQSCSIVAIS